MINREIGVGVIGLGVVAGQVAKSLHEREAMLSERVGAPLKVRKIKVLPSDLERPLVKELGTSLFTTDDDEFFNTPGLDIVVEAIGGEHPALEYLQRALKSGKHVATSNKEVVSKHWAELTLLAQRNNVALQYEASAGGGIPLIAPFRHDLVANKITKISAIINGTTNYILTRMANEGLDFEPVLKDAQKLGYAEANPRDDIEGIDASYKLAILASLAFQCEVRPQQIYHEGISKLSSSDFRYAREFGYAIKLLAIAKRVNNDIEVRVHPVFLALDTLLSKVDGVFNAILVDGDLVGEVLFYGRGAGAEPTSSAVIADVVTVARDLVSGYAERPARELKQDRVIKSMDDIVTRYYLRMKIVDRPGVLAQIAQVFADGNISISSAIQQEAEAEAQAAEIVLMTHPAREAAMQTALKCLDGLENVKEINSVIRVED